MKLEQREGIEMKPPASEQVSKGKWSSALGLEDAARGSNTSASGVLLFSLHRLTLFSDICLYFLCRDLSSLSKRGRSALAYKK